MSLIYTLTFNLSADGKTRLWGMYWLNYLDRNAIALARLNDLEEDLNLSSSQYQTCVSILFVGYILGQVPSNMLITRLRPSYYMSSCMALWAVVSALTALSKNFTGLLLTRFFLGVVEAPYYPGALYLLGVFYTRKEIATRISILYTGNILATAFAGLIAAGIFKMDGMGGLAGWKWSVIQSAMMEPVTDMLALQALHHPRCRHFCHRRRLSLRPPRRPSPNPLAHSRRTRTRQLTHCGGHCRCKASDRLLGGPQGGCARSEDLAFCLHAGEFNKSSISTPSHSLIILPQHMHLAANGFKNFFPTAVETLGFNSTITLVLTCPPYLIAGVVSIAWSWSSGRYNERTWHITVAKAVAIFGFILGCATLNTGAKYFAMGMSSHIRRFHGRSLTLI